MTTFNPDKWLTSLMRSLTTYVETKLNLTDVYELRFEWPMADELAEKMPFSLTILHFEIDDPQLVPFGLGDNVVDGVYDELGGTLEEWEAHCHEVDINVGVWASVSSGGPSARLEARQDLDTLFVGPAAREACMTITDGVEIMNFSGGQFVNDVINDQPVFRVVDAVLRVRVYSRTKKVPVSFINEIDQSPGIEIDGTVIVG